LLLYSFKHKNNVLPQGKFKKDPYMRRSLTTLVLALVCALSVNAQDIHFSQFYMSPLNLNPAMTGIMNCTQRLTFNHRNQWSPILRSKSYQTYSFSYDQRIPIGRYDYMGVGGTLWRDEAGTVDYGQLQAKLSASYSKRMAGGRHEGHYLVAGFEAGAQQTGLDLSKAQWGTQHNGNGGFDANAPSNENFNRNSIIFADLSAGLLWFSVFSNDNTFYVGGAYHHLNRPNISFNRDKKEILYSRFTGHVGGEFKMGDKTALVPNAIIMFQGKSMEVTPGVSLKFLLSKFKYDKQSFQIGAWTRIANKPLSGVLNDALILTTRFDYNQFTIGFSYDATTSLLRKAAPTTGGYEFSLMYNICGRERRNVYCPSF
jgi:type IX secretion system PorP/SprF family membrane protein